MPKQGIWRKDYRVLPKFPASNHQQGAEMNQNSYEEIMKTVRNDVNEVLDIAHTFTTELPMNDQGFYGMQIVAKGQELCFWVRQLMMLSIKGAK
jgi:hypothetical protein